MELPTAAKAVALRGLYLLPFVAASLRTGGLTRTRSRLNSLVRPVSCSPALGPREIARLVHGAAAFLHIGCLPRALLLLRFLGDYGTRVEIRFGVQLAAAGGLAAHAWIEFDGEVLGERPDGPVGYAALPPLRG